MKPYIEGAIRPYKSEVGDTRTPIRKCEAPGCNATTRVHKPYCTEHIEQSPYVQRILSVNEFPRF